MQRTEIQLNGTIVDGQHVQGEYQAAQDKVVLTASSPLCGGGDILPNFGRKFFSLIRVDGVGGGISLDQNDDGSVDCDEVNLGDEVVLNEFEVSFDEPDSANCLVPSEEGGDYPLVSFAHRDRSLDLSGADEQPDIPMTLSPIPGA